MTPEEIQAMAKGLAQGQAVWYVLSACIGGAITGLGTYLAEKGKNRATKEDIAVITTKVKEVEDVFNRGLSDLNAHHQLRMVAAERRLQAHQDAFAKWKGLYRAVCHEQYDQIVTLANEGLNWFDANCVFLTSESRSAFHDARSAALVHASYLRNPNGPLSDGEVWIANWNRLEDAGNKILESVSLPRMSIEEIKAAEVAPASAPPG